MPSKENIQTAFDYLKSKGIVHTQKDVAEKMSVTSVNISRALSGDKKYLTKNFLERFNVAFDNIFNTEWLLTGKGEMFYTAPYLVGIAADTEFPYNSKANKNKTVPLIPISAQAGKLTDFVTQTKKEDCEQVITPVLDAEYAIRVAGDSMEPEYPNGSQILIKKIDEKIFIDWGKTYVLDTCNGTIIKKLMPATKEGYVKCVSINPDYPAFEVPITENAIFGVYRVIMCMSIK